MPTEHGVTGLKGFKNTRSLILIFIGIAVNLLLSELMTVTGCPLYLDAVGTVITASLSGYIPGIIVGLVTNIIKALTNDPSAIYYGTLNVIIALIAAYTTRRKYFRKIWKIIIVILLCTFVGGVLGSILTWFLYGFASVGITSNFAQYIHDTTGMSEFMSQFSADVLTDLLDKTITISIIAILRKVLPDDFKRSLRLYGWRQEPLAINIKSEVRKVVTGVASLRTKMTVLISAALLIIAITATTIGYILYKQSITDKIERIGLDVTGTVVNVLDADKIDDYIARGHEAEGYDEAEEIFSTILNSSTDIQFLYVYAFREDGCHVVFDIDTPEAAADKFGDVLEYDEGFLPHKQELLKGEKIDTMITDDSYGWLLTVCNPVYNEKGECVCYACADISMAQLTTECYGFLAREISLFLGVFILILTVGLWLAHYNIIMPVNSMAVSTAHFSYQDEESLEESVDRLKHLGIRTGDEIENLYHSFVKTSEENVHYVTDIQSKTETISKMQSGLILVLADVVESRDENTGFHIRKTAAYAGLVLKGLRQLGYYSDQITDTFIQDVVSAAPLHDIGKIEVPDAILNKPGRLDDDEYEIMKTHAMAGSRMIQKAMKNVPDSGYLNEAKNLAEFHHEKWNGQGYPHGLKGEEIPLSARALAVADVFDALVSKRIYKPPFTIDEALKIIREGSGTHFDPKIVEAFFLMEKEIRGVAETFSEDTLNNLNYELKHIHLKGL